MTLDQPGTAVRIGLSFMLLSDEDMERPYRVIVENDDVTPMEFVTAVLERFFAVDPFRAEQIMLTAHFEGRAHVVTLPLAEAQQRVYEAHHVARQAEYPLTFHLEPEER
jgi:ATP-dependent Clp protease adaptor protein ClpS